MAGPREIFEEKMSEAATGGGKVRSTPFLCGSEPKIQVRAAHGRVAPQIPGSYIYVCMYSRVRRTKIIYITYEHRSY